jgi:hypothetical protein
MMRCDDLATAAAFVVHSSVRWDAAWQRPQEIFSRLARTCNVLYVESPVFLDDVVRPALDRSEPMPGIHRVVPRLPAMYAALEHATQVMVRTLLLEWLGSDTECRTRFESPVQWYCTAAPASAMLGAFDARAIVYDRLTDGGAETGDAVAVTTGATSSATSPADAHRERCIGERLLLAHADIVLNTGRAISEMTQACWERMAAEMLRLTRLPFGAS